MIIYIVGVNGIGKTTLIDLIIKTNSVEVIKGSAKLMAVLGIKIGDYAALRMIPEKVKQEAFIKILESLHKSNTNYLIDGHLFNLRGTKTVSVFSKRMLKLIDVMILITANLQNSFIRLEPTRASARGIFLNNQTLEDKRAAWKQYLEFTEKRFDFISSQNSNVKFYKIANDNINLSQQALQLIINFLIHTKSE